MVNNIDIQKANSKRDILHITLEATVDLYHKAQKQNNNYLAKELNAIIKELEGKNIVLEEDLQFAHTKISSINRTIRNQNEEYENKSILFSLEEKLQPYAY